MTGENKSSIDSNIQNTTDKLIKWFETNRLIVNKEKTVAISFHLIQNKNIDLPIIPYQDETVNYVSETKFLGVWLDQNLNWKKHIEVLANRLSKVSFALRTVAKTSGLNSIRALYYGCFHSLMTYGVMFWGNSPESKFIFKLQKKALRIIMKVSNRTSCRPLFKELRILPLPCIYILETLVYIKTNLGILQKNSNIHSHNTRNKNDLSTIPHKTSLYEKSFTYTGLKLYNRLPQHTKEISAIGKFKNVVQTILQDKCYYTVQEYLNEY